MGCTFPHGRRNILRFARKPKGCSEKSQGPNTCAVLGGGGRKWSKLVLRRMIAGQGKIFLNPQCLVLGPGNLGASISTCLSNTSTCIYTYQHTRLIKELCSVYVSPAQTAGDILPRYTSIKPSGVHANGARQEVSSTVEGLLLIFLDTGLFLVISESRKPVP